MNHQAPGGNRRSEYRFYDADGLIIADFYQEGPCGHLGRDEDARRAAASFENVTVTRIERLASDGSWVPVII